MILATSTHPVPFFAFHPVPSRRRLKYLDPPLRAFPETVSLTLHGFRPPSVIFLQFRRIFPTSLPRFEGRYPQSWFPFGLNTEFSSSCGFPMTSFYGPPQILFCFVLAFRFKTFGPPLAVWSMLNNLSQEVFLILSPRFSGSRLCLCCCNFFEPRSFDAFPYVLSTETHAPRCTPPPPPASRRSFAFKFFPTPLRKQTFFLALGPPILYSQLFLSDIPPHFPGLS